ncbi:MAG: AMP-binding protein [Actinomycetota bacterium]|nr:AMP-binding protein [Actinomycetota bacterium]
MVKLATLPDLLRRAAVAQPNWVAATIDDGPSITYHTWERRSDSMARGLVRRAVRPGDRVGLLFDTARWTEYAVTYLAVHKAAAVAVPLGADLVGLELDRVLRDCQPALVVTPPDLAPRGASVPVISGNEFENEAGGPLPPPVRPSALAEILYLSRPLSRPVPLPRSHREVLAGPSLDLGTGPSFPSLLHALPVGTIAGQDVLCACLDPRPVRSVVLPAFEPERFCALLSAEPIQAGWLHPSLARALLDSGAPARQDLSGITRLVLSSAPAPPELLLGLMAAFPRATLLTVDVLAHPPRLRTVFRHDRSRPASIGRPLDGTAAWVTDEAGRPVGSGEVGRVCVSAAPAPGEQQAAAEAGEGAATADFGYVDDRGFLYVVTGRNDVVGCRTSTVIGTEVESALRAHPVVVDAGAFGVPVDPSGNELAAAVVLASPAPGSGVSPLPRRPSSRPWCAIGWARARPPGRSSSSRSCHATDRGWFCEPSCAAAWVWTTMKPSWSRRPRRSKRRSPPHGGASSATVTSASTTSSSWGATGSPPPPSFRCSRMPSSCAYP